MNDNFKNTCIKCLDRLKAKPICSILILFLIFLFVPLIIFISYLIGDNGFILINTSLTVGDALTFYTSFLTFCGTILLGIIAVWQNNNATKISNRLLDIEIEKICPVIEIEKNKINLKRGIQNERYPDDNYAVIKPQHENPLNWNLLTFHLNNVSDNLGKEISLVSCKLKKKLNQKKLLIAQ